VDAGLLQSKSRPRRRNAGIVVAARWRRWAGPLTRSPPVPAGRVWSNNSSVKFQCCHSGFVLDSCAVNLSPCLGKSCWLVSLDKSMRPCARNWSSFWKKTICISRSWNGIHLTGGCRMLIARFSPRKANPSVSCWRTSSPYRAPIEVIIRGFI
jgi:hypothetical protein